MFGSSMKYDIDITFNINSKIRQLNFLYSISSCVLENYISASFTVFARLTVRFSYRSIEPIELLLVL